MNRRVRTRTHGGVGGRKGQPFLPPDTMESDYVIKDESCFQCGISCHKNVYAETYEDGQRKAGKFYAKLDYEPSIS